jgi:hypothetical protein
MTVLRDSQFYGNWTDDRPPKLPDGWLADLNERAKAIVEKYPNPVAAHTEESMLELRKLQAIAKVASRVGSVLFPDTLADQPLEYTHDSESGS